MKCKVVCACFPPQTLLPDALYSVLFLVDKDGSAKLDRDLNVQVKCFFQEIALDFICR